MMHPSPSTPPPPGSPERFHLRRDSFAAFAWLTGIFLVIHAFELTAFNLSIDDEIFAYSRPDALIELGRWSHAVIRYLLWDQPVLPFAPYVLFALAFAYAHLRLLRLFEVTTLGPFELIAYAAYAAFPAWLAQLEFQVNVLPVAAGLIAATWAAEAATTPRPWRALPVAGLCLAFAIGAYQSFIFFFLALAIGLALAGSLRGRPARALTAGLVRFAIAAILGMVFWYLILQAFEAGFNKTPHGYAAGFQRFDLLLKDPGAVLAATGHQWLEVYVLAWRDFGHAAAVFGAALGLAAILILMGAAGGARRRWAAAGLLVALFLMPMALNLVSGGRLPLRTYLAVPLVVWIVLFLAHRGGAGGTRRTLLVAAALVALNGLFVQATVQARAWVMHRHDSNLAQAINIRAAAALGADQPARVTIDFHGRIRPKTVYPAVPTTTAGASFFAWDGGSPARMVRLMNLIGYTRFVSLPPQRRQELHGHYAGMPVWPRPGSVKAVGGVVLVKLSN